MAFTYQADMVTWTDLNWLRFIIGDTDSSYPFFTDAELNAIIAKHTVEAVVDFDVCEKELLQALSADPIRVIQSKMATAGGIALTDEMDLYAARAADIAE